MMNSQNRLPRALLLLCAASPLSFSGTFTNNFNNGTPPGSAVYGNAVVDSTGGMDNSGVLKLTKAVGSQNSSFILDDLDAGTPVYGFNMNFKARIDGGGTPADGFSVNFAPDLPQAGFGEGGAGTGLTVSFDIYINNPPETSRTISVKSGGVLVASKNMSLADITTGTNFENVHIALNPNGALDVSFKNQTIFTNLFLPNYQPIAGQFGFGGRTGGAFANQFIDDLSVTTFLQPQTGISSQPASLTALAGTDVTLAATVTNPEGATFQWFKNGTAIAGATSTNLTLSAVALGDSGAKYKLQVTGPNNSVTSQDVTVTVRDITLPATPALSLNFNDGQTPANTLLANAAVINSAGGVGGTGALQLTSDSQDGVGQSGAFVINDLSSSNLVYGFTAEFDVLLRSAGTPADGFSFSFAPDITDDPTTGAPRAPVEGVGNGLTVSFDTYDNGGGEAPAIDIMYNGQTIASKKVPISFLMTGDEFAHVIIHVSNEGTVDVVYKNQVIHDKVALPGFTSFSGGRFALAGNTGGLSSDQIIDNIEITPETTVGPLRFATQPTVQTVLAGKQATFTSTVNDTNGVTFQYFKNGTLIAGATSSSFTTPATTAADNGALYKVQASRGGTVVTSSEVALNVVNLSAPSAPTVSFDFADGQIPAGTHVFGTGPVDAPWTPIVNNGVLELVEAVNGQAGAFVIDPLLGGAEVSAINVAFDLLIGGGSNPPADGLSFNFAPDLPSATSGAAEDGVGTGLSLGFDIYDNVNETPPAPSIDLKYKGVLLASKHLTTDQIQTGDTYRTVLLSLAPDGTINVSFGDQVIFSGIRATNYTFISNGKFGFYARTGGLNANQFVDNIKIQVTKSTAPLRVTQDPVGALLLAGQTATFSVGVSDPNGVTYQWLKNGTPIAGATSATFITPALTAADTGASYTVTVTGPGGTATSQAAIATVVAPLTISNPIVNYDFETGVAPDGTSVNGANAAFITPGGTNGTVLQLTEAAGSEGGGFVIPDQNNGEPVSAMTVHFQIHINNGSGTPADGLAFVWANDLPLDAALGEAGGGSGLIVSFDTYQNVGEEAPAIQVSYKGTVVARQLVPYSLLATGEGFADVFIRVNSNGTLDLQYKNTPIFSNLQLPGYTPTVGGLFGFGARTGGEFEEHWIDNVQIATGTGAAAPQLSITKSGTGVLTVSWTGSGTLQAKDNLDAATPWTPVAGATSPYTAPNDSKMRFFRVVQ